ncbi:MAG: MATE family efflux transporter [Ruminococcus sp.]|nr:MATE family efflux transporter [Ruminococcus sp.]
MSNAVQQENKMGVMPIPKLLISMSLPMIISMLVQALYNIVDSMFVAQMNEAALTAVSLAFPVQNLMIAFAAGTGVGINALLSRSLGEKNLENANKVASNGAMLAMITSAVFAVVGGFGGRLFFALQTDDAQIIEYGAQYLRVVTICSMFVFLQVTFERLLQSTGKTVYSMITQATGAIINIILDPIMIFGYFGFPALGVLGAALATVCGQFVATLLAVHFHNKYNKEIIVRRTGFKPDKNTIISIYKVGIPSIIMQSIGSITTFALNNILLMFSSTAATVFGIYFKLQSFVFMPIFGLTNGMIPIVAYNYGARKKKRIYATLKLSICIAVGIMIIGVVYFQLYPKTLLGLFDASEHMLEIGVPALRTISWSFIFAGFCIISSSVFQALGNGVYSMLISIARQIVVIIPVAYIFAKVFGLDMVWWSYPIAEIVSVCMCTFFLKKIFKEKLSNLED